MCENAHAEIGWLVCAGRERERPERRSAWCDRAINDLHAGIICRCSARGKPIGFAAAQLSGHYRPAEALRRAGMNAANRLP
jgi:hypothetical protein